MPRGALSPVNIPGLQLWLDDTSLIQSSGLLTQWRDKSAHANHATPFASQPTIQAAALNGLDTVRFTSPNSDSVTGQYCLLTAPISLPQSTVCAVIRRAGPVGENFIELLGNSTNDQAVRGEWWNDQRLYTGDGVVFWPSTAVPSVDYNQVTFVSSGSTATDRIYVNGVDATDIGFASPAASSLVFDQIFRTDATFTNGEVAAVLVFDSVLSDADRQAMEALQKARYATP